MQYTEQERRKRSPQQKVLAMYGVKDILFFSKLLFCSFDNAYTITNARYKKVLICQFFAIRNA